MIVATILLLLLKDNMDPLVRFLIAIACIIVIAIIAAITNAGRSSNSPPQSKTSYTYTATTYTAPTYTAPVRDPNLWYGEMGCYNCGYRWKSRKNTPPASCPSCRSKNISTITGSKPFVRNEPQTQSYSPSEPPQPATSQTPYDVLQVSPTASIDEISAAYKSMAQMYHPDKVASLAPEYRVIAERRMKEINAAYATLKAKEQEKAVTLPDTSCGDGPDELYEALIIVTDMGRASTSVLQRRLSIGYGRAAEILDALEREGLIGSADGAKPRKVLRAAYELRERIEQNPGEKAD